LIAFVDYAVALPHSTTDQHIPGHCHHRLHVNVHCLHLPLWLHGVVG